MKLANACSADDVSVRLCFFVNVRNARGLRVAGGRSMGSTDGLDGSEGLAIRIGWTGVLKAGDEGKLEFGCVGFWATRKRDAMRVFAALVPPSISSRFIVRVLPSHI